MCYTIEIVQGYCQFLEGKSLETCQSGSGKETEIKLSPSIDIPIFDRESNFFPQNSAEIRIQGFFEHGSMRFNRDLKEIGNNGRIRDKKEDISKEEKKKKIRVSVSL